ncbi:MAG: hypothetical protein P8H88_03980 [Flavobacteriales bacterium]|nr:hypothetical protein [Flavobacteriales bacterium]
MIRRSALLLLVSLAFALQGWSQTRLHLYPDDNLVWRDMIAHVADGVVRLGNSWSGETLYTVSADNMWDETRVFQGYSTSSLDIAFTVRDEGKLYLGDSSFTDAILYTFKDGQIFVGDSTFPLDVAYTLREESRKFAGRGDAPIWGVYREDSRSWSDRVAVLEGALDPGALFALLSAAGLL